MREHLKPYSLLASMPLIGPYGPRPNRMIGIPCFARLMCTAHLLRPLYLKILDPPLPSRIAVP